MGDDQKKKKRWRKGKNKGRWPPSSGSAFIGCKLTIATANMSSTVFNRRFKPANFGLLVAVLSVCSVTLACIAETCHERNHFDASLKKYLFNSDFIYILLLMFSWRWVSTVVKFANNTICWVDFYIIKIFTTDMWNL